MSTIIQQGSFTSDGAARFIPLRSDVDWMEVYNFTQAAAAQTTAVGVQYYWQRGLAPGGGFVYFKANAANADNLFQTLSTTGFTLLENRGPSYGPLQSTITAISAAAPPVVTNTGTNGLVAGDIVRLTNVAGGQQLCGIDYEVGNGTLSATTFSLDFMPLIVAATTGSFRRLLTPRAWYPSTRTISAMSQGTNMTVTTTVSHNLTVGQRVRLNVPSIYGMREANGLTGRVTAVISVETVQLDIDSSAFTAFGFPLTADVPFTFAQMIPFGQGAGGTGGSDLDGALRNEAEIGISLFGGANAPAGANNDVMYWRAGKSFNVENV